MDYEWIQKRGALHGSDDAAVAESVALSVLLPESKSGSAEEAVTDLLTRRIRMSVIELVPENVARANHLIPISCDEETIFFAAADPDDIATADKLRFILAKDVRLLRAPREDIQRAIDRYYGVPEAEAVDSMICEFTETAIDFDDNVFDELGSAASDYELASEEELFDAASPASARTKMSRRRRPVSGAEYRMDYRNDSLNGRSGMFYFTVDEGERVLMTDRDGRSSVVEGPQRIWKGNNRFESMPSTVAHPGEFLVVRYRDGRQENISGPTLAWFDRRLHKSIDKQESLQIGANEAIVVYTKDDDSGSASRRVETGPQVFTPKPGEWLHTFQWHAAKGGSQGAPKVAKGLVFQKLWLMPDQMYHDVPDVRTADDAVLTIRLMIFFELEDVQQMLDTTHDPIGDFVNAATADVVEFTGQFDFDTFKQETNRLNELDTYQHLLNRAAQVGYRISNIVYRGYGAPDSLQQMHDQAIEARTRLQLERATEEQSQQLEDFQLESQLARASRRRSEQADEVRHDLAISREKQEAARDSLQAQAVQTRELQAESDAQQAEAQRGRNQTQQDHLKVLKDLGVDLTQYLTQMRADQVIELRGDGVKPHLHVEKS